MKIQVEKMKNDNLVDFEYIKIGECFKFFNEYFIKIKNIYNVEEEVIINAIGLKGYDEGLFRSNDKIEKVESILIIKEN